MPRSRANFSNGTATTTFYKVVTNAATAWLYGASSVNCSLLGIGERTGNCPLEAMAIEYASLRGTDDGMDFTAITDIARYFEDELGYIIPPNTPFVGRSFNATRAGIHADGMLKDPEIYNIFDTAKILGRPARVSINNASGLAGHRLLDQRLLFPARGVPHRQAGRADREDEGADRRGIRGGAQQHHGRRRAG